MSHLKVISVDWLALYCDFTNVRFESNIECRLMPYSTRQFKIVEVIYKDGIKFATITRAPSSTVLKQGTGIIKFENNLLYLAHWFSLIDNFLMRSNIDVINVSRIDICADFQSFIDYSNPHDFITDFLRGKILKNGRSRFSLQGRHDLDNVYNYFRVGEKGADVNVYLYDKSLEMQEVKFKHHINEVWKKAGFDVNRKVWRLEVSISGKGKNFLDESSGEIKEILFFKLSDFQFIADVYFSYLKKFFSFKVNDGLKNKSRMPDVKLFDNNFEKIRLSKLPKMKDSTRADKVFLKKVHNYKDERKDATEDEVRASQTMIRHLIKDEFLKDYYVAKSSEWTAKT